MFTINGEKCEFTKFPNGEVGAQLVMGEVPIEIVWRYEGDHEFMQLAFIARNLRKDDDVRLVVPYFPYSRMDRASGDWIFTLQPATEFVNELDFEEVTIWEPHSDVLPALLNTVTVRYPTAEYLTQLMYDIEFDVERDFLIFPDAGAEKRYSQFEWLGKLNTIVGMKKRDFNTGTITGFDLLGNVAHWRNGPPAKVIIIDDLCSYGGTFNAVLNELPARITEAHLLVAHCENSVYQGKLLKNPVLKGLHTTDSIHPESRHEKVKIYNV